MKKFLIAEAEKSRILGMHYKAMGKKLIKEGNEFLMTPEETKATGLTSVQAPDEYRFDAGGFNIFFHTDAFEMRDKVGYYDCIQDPRDKDDPPAGTMYDQSNNRLTAAQAGLKGPYMNIFRKYCKTAYNWLADYNAKNAPQPQVAAATTAKVTAPNPNSSAQLDAEAQKRSEASKAQRQQQMTEFQKLISTHGFLDSTKDDTTLDNEVTQLSKYLGLQFKPLDSEGIRSLLTSMSRLVKAKPKYGAEPYGLTGYINTLRTEL